MELILLKTISLILASPNHELPIEIVPKDIFGIILSVVLWMGIHKFKHPGFTSLSKINASRPYTRTYFKGIFSDGGYNGVRQTCQNSK